jgi:HlyD family secretion protein
MTRRGIKVGLGLLLLLVLTVGTSYWLWGQGKSSSSTGAPTAPSSSGGESVVHVRVVKPQPGGVTRTVQRPASVRPFQYAQLFTKVSGYLQNQKVDIGERVKEGQQLAEIFAPEILADLHKAESDLTKAKAHVEVMKARIVEAEAQFQQAQDKLAQAQADLQSARAMETLRKEQFTRIKKLAEQNAIEQELVDEKRAAHLAAEATTRSAEKAVSTATSGVAAAKADVARMRAELQDAEAEVLVAQAVLDRARAFEAYTRVRSPYTGLITQRGYHEGDFIREATSARGDKPVLTVTRTDVMRVIVWVPDPDVPFTHPGEHATVRVDALPGRTFSGKVARTAGAEDPVSRTMRTEIDLPNPDGLLQDGMYGSITIELGKKQAAVTIPSAAMTGDDKDGQRAVFVVKDGHARRVTVRVGLDDGIHAEILKGLTVQDQVVVQHAPGLADGAAVAVAEPPPQPQ